MWENWRKKPDTALLEVFEMKHKIQERGRGGREALTLLGVVRVLRIVWSYLVGARLARAIWWLELVGSWSSAVSWSQVGPDRRYCAGGPPPAVKHHKRDVKCLTTKTILNFALLILSLILAYLDLALGFVSFRIRHHKNSFAAILWTCKIDTHYQVEKTAPKCVISLRSWPA